MKLIFPNQNVKVVVGDDDDDDDDDEEAEDMEGTFMYNVNNIFYSSSLYSSFAYPGTGFL